MPWIRTLAVIFTLFSTAALAQPVIKDGKEWLQPADFLNLSWDDVALVCDPGTGLCDGELNSIDVTGYTWASVDDVNGLFNTYGVTPPLSGDDAVWQANSSWAPSFLNQFHPVIHLEYRSVWGVVRAAPNNSNLVYCPWMIDSNNDAYADSAVNGANCSRAYPDADLGVWLYTVAGSMIATPVPTAPTYVLIFTVLGLLVIATRRLSRRNAREG